MRNAFLFRRRTFALASVATAFAVGAVGAGRGGCHVEHAGRRLNPRLLYLPRQW